MKSTILTGVLAFSLSGVSAVAQDIPQSQVPSLVVNSFQQTFSKAGNIEWEQDGELFKAEFETGLLATDHDVWFDKTGKLVKHKEEISKSDLPKNVLASLDKEFKGFRTEDVKKISEGSIVNYILEMKSLTQEWKVAIDSEGKVLSKIAD